MLALVWIACHGALERPFVLRDGPEVLRELLAELTESVVGIGLSALRPTCGGPRWIVPLEHLIPCVGSRAAYQRGH